MRQTGLAKIIYGSLVHAFGRTDQKSGQQGGSIPANQVDETVLEELAPVLSQPDQGPRLARSAHNHLPPFEIQLLPDPLPPEPVLPVEPSWIGSPGRSFQITGNLQPGTRLDLPGRAGQRQADASRTGDQCRHPVRARRTAT